MKIIRKIFDDPFSDSFEVVLRHIMCIFMTFETMFICRIIIMLIGTDTIILLKYHEEPLSTILFPFMLCVFFIGITLLSFFYKTMYLIYEGLHVLVGIWISLYLTGNFAGIIFLAVLSVRLAVYLIIMEVRNSRLAKQKRQNDSSNL